MAGYASCVWGEACCSELTRKPPRENLSRGNGYYFLDRDILIIPNNNDRSSFSPFVIGAQKTIGRLIAATNIKIKTNSQIFVEASITTGPYAAAE